MMQENHYWKNNGSSLWYIEEQENVHNDTKNLKALLR